VVGVCGGVPEPQSGKKILLGDVVISKAIVQYDVESPCERDTLGESFGMPRQKIRNFMTSLERNRTQREVEAKAAAYLEELQSRAKGKRRAANYQYPGAEKDRLFTSSYKYKHHTPYDIRPRKPCDVCDANRKMWCRGFACGEQQFVVRNLSFNQNLEKVGRFETAAPSIIIGNIGSGDTVLRSAKERERLAKVYDLVAFEMEGAGAWDQVPSIVVKGVCDYADHFKNKEWQNFAAATAAAVSKALIELYPRAEKPDTRIVESVDETHQGFVYVWASFLCVCVIVTGVHLSGGKQVFNF
jgi:nucleoside phosphorylase